MCDVVDIVFLYDGESGGNTMCEILQDNTIVDIYVARILGRRNGFDNSGGGVIFLLGKT
jgi:hypothetical protein